MTIAPGRRVRRIALTTSVAVWLVYITTAGGSMATGDAVAMFETARSMIDRGTLDVPASQSSELWRGVDGRYYTPFGIGQSLFDVPFVLAGRVATDLTGISLGDPDTIPKTFVAAASTVPAAVAVGFALLLAWRLSFDLRSSVLTALVVAFGTLLWPYAKFGFNAALATATLTSGIYGVAAGTAERRPWTVAAGGAGLGAALLTRHELFIAAALALAWIAWQIRHDGASALRLLAAAATPVCVALALSMTLNAVRFGNPWHSGHEPTFALEGFRAFLVSPSGALLVYSPPALAGAALIFLARSGNVISQLLLAISVALFVFYALLDDWLGTRSYGPRYLVPLLPLLVAPLATWFRTARTPARRLALAALCLAGVLVQLPAVAVDFSRAGIEAGQPPQFERRDVFFWSPIAVNARAVLPAATSSLRALISDTPAAAETVPGRSLWERLPFGLDFWWLHLFHLGVLSRPAALIAGLLPLIVAAWLLRRSLAAASAVDRSIERSGVVG